MSSANLAPTAILDYTSPEIAQTAAKLGAASLSPRELLRAAHRYITSVMRPIYSLKERYPVSGIRRPADPPGAGLKSVRRAAHGTEEQDGDPAGVP